VSIGFLNDQRHVIKDSRDRTRSESSGVNANVRSSEVVEESWRIKIIDRGYGDVDDATCAIKGFLECVQTSVLDYHLEGYPSEKSEGQGRGRVGDPK
jgi:hypothetical protein